MLVELDRPPPACARACFAGDDKVDRLYGRNFLLIAFPKNTNTGERAPRCPVSIWAYGVVVVLFSKSECTQQDGGDEQEHGAHRQHIEPQGKVHVRASLMVE